MTPKIKTAANAKLPNATPYKNPGLLVEGSFAALLRDLFLARALTLLIAVEP